MTALSERLSSARARIAVGAIALVVVLAGAWLVVVSPQRSKVSDLKQSVDAARAELVTRQQAIARPSANVKVRASDTYRLTKALPDSAGMAGVILDVNRIANAHSLTFTSIAPAPAVQGTSYTSQPVTLVLQGRFNSVSGFLGDVRGLVRVRKSMLDARGRLYSVTSVDLGKADGAEFPVVKATVTLQSFTFSGTPPAADTGTTQPTPSSSGTVAAGATP
jgi:Tfp pilus assembly protein PilO